MSDETMSDEFDAIFDEYQAHFAGKPRSTRDLELLDELIERLETALDEARDELNGGRGRLAEMVEQGEENLRIYRSEREAIERVQQQGPEVVEAGILATWANAEFHRYNRHFAGSPRPTRDVELLNEMITELKVVRDRMHALRDNEEAIEGLDQDIETVETNLEEYRNERERIVEAQHSGDLDDRASYLAEIANSQFQIYRTLFGGKSRVTRRPKLLRRMIRTLESTKRQMEKLRERGLESQENEGNIEIVENTLETYREELEAVEDAKRGVDPDELVGHLGRAANEIFEAYREEFAGADRRTRDLGQLSWMCDELYHLARAMQETIDAGAGDSGRENLEIVLDNLSLYQREFDEIYQLQADD
jgi:hypothetical protein